MADEPSTRQQIGEHTRSVARNRIFADDLDQLRGVVQVAGAEYRFPPHLEEEFDRHVRLSTASARRFICLLGFCLFATQHIWSPLLVDTSAESQRANLLVSLLMAPLLFIVAILQFRSAVCPLAEGALCAAFLVMVAAIEVMRLNGASAGPVVDASLTVTVPLGLMALARLNLSRCLLFVAGYFAIILAAQLAWSDSIGRRSPTEWLTEVILLATGLTGAGFSMLSYRRQWAASVLLELAVRRDRLTGLANRAAFEEHYELLSAANLRSNTVMFLVLIDLDHFKKINDLYGHPHGDSVLMQIGAALERFARRDLDLAARLGGEEFILLLEGCSREDGDRRLNALLQDIRDLHLEHRGNEAGVVTLSAGCTLVPPGMPLCDAYRIADECLYRVKQSGRNGYLISDTRPAARTQIT